MVLNRKVIQVKFLFLLLVSRSEQNEHCDICCPLLKRRVTVISLDSVGLLMPTFSNWNKGLTAKNKIRSSCVGSIFWIEKSMKLTVRLVWWHTVALYAASHMVLSS